MKDAGSELLPKNLGLSPTGEVALYGESLFTGRALPNGWFILFVNQCEHEFAKPEVLASLSNLGDVVACSIEEHVMWCKAELWSNGRQVWQIEHDSQKNRCHLSTSGSLPEGFSKIKETFAEQQKQSGGVNSDTDYFFEIPLQTAKRIVGFKHDEVGHEDESFQVFKYDSSSSFPKQIVRAC